ncbi:MAG: hypothetical protein IJ062_00185 [Firmicutes bacterium]|nr:hypothetical protein [Bacillota bacterium]
METGCLTPVSLENSYQESVHKELYFKLLCYTFCGDIDDKLSNDADMEDIAKYVDEKVRQLNEPELLTIMVRDITNKSDFSKTEMNKFINYFETNSPEFVSYINIAYEDK